VWGIVPSARWRTQSLVAYPQLLVEGRGYIRLLVVEVERNFVELVGYPIG
jgi:hypothetical protein